MQLSQNSHPPRKRRVELACVPCRKKKSRCDGQQPSCLSCIKQETQCCYENASPERNVLARSKSNSRARLMRRVKELEDQLASISSVEHCRALPENTPPIDEVPEDPVEHVPDEGAVDTLATEAFNEVPEDNIGHFGPTSNHFLFRSLSTVFAQGAFRRNCTHTVGDLEHSQVKLHLQVPRKRVGEKQVNNGPHLHDIYVLPDGQRLTKLINKFCDTVSTVLPYVSRDFLLTQVNKQHTRPMRALLNIICAYASLTLENGDSEVFYRRALALLDDHTVRGSSLELIQTLLLLASFQQNNQRAVASWTCHALVVKAAYQLGIHWPFPHKDIQADELEVRRTLWHAVVNQDRYLGIALGRPFLIPPQYSRTERPCLPPVRSCDIPSSLYFHHLTSLHSVQSCIIESFYEHNLGPSDNVPLQDLVIKRLQLLSKLNEWRRNASSFCEIVGDIDLRTWTASWFEENKFQILLSIQFYKTLLLVNRPMIIGILNAGRDDQHTRKDTALPLDYMVPVIKEDIAAAKYLQTIIHTTATRGGSFLDFNAVWWTCNYTSFTVILHLFGTLLACQLPEYEAAFPEPSITDIRSSLGRALDTLQAVGRTSLMSRKARQCVEGFLHVYDSLTAATERPPEGTFSVPLDLNGTGPTTLDPLPDEELSEDLFSRLISQSADEFLFQCSNSSFLDADFNYL